MSATQVTSTTPTFAPTPAPAVNTPPLAASSQPDVLPPAQKDASRKRKKNTEEDEGPHLVSEVFLRVIPIS